MKGVVMSEGREIENERITSLFGLLTIKDIIAILSVAVSLTLAWGVFSTRITLLEHQLIAYREENKQIVESVKGLQRQQNSFDRGQIEDRYMIDELWTSVKGTPPRRQTQIFPPGP